MLSAFEELNSVEIAEVLGITESSVRSRLFRARNLMAELLNHARSHQMNSYRSQFNVGKAGGKRLQVRPKKLCV